MRTSNEVSSLQFNHCTLVAYNTLCYSEQPRKTQGTVLSLTSIVCGCAGIFSIAYDYNKKKKKKGWSF